MSGNFAIDTLLRADERLARIDWPNLVPVDHITLQANDCVIVASGFEERALAGLEQVCTCPGDFSVALIRYLPKVDQNQGLRALDLCEAHQIPVVEFTYDREEPAGIGPQLAAYAQPFDRVILDISGMSRLLIVQTIVALLQSDIVFEVLYAEAEVYLPEKGAFDEAHSAGNDTPSFLSSGIFEVASSPELSSVAMLGAAIRLISFPSFDPKQLDNLIQEVQPTHNDVVHGIPPDLDLHWRTDAISRSNRSFLSTMQRVEEHRASTLDYRETLQLILRIYAAHAAFDRIVIAPTGSKMQAVAVAIIRAVLNDIQIVYPTPLKFEDPGRYTEGVKQLYLLQPPYGAIQALMRA